MDFNGKTMLRKDFTEAKTLRRYLTGKPVYHEDFNENLCERERTFSEKVKDFCGMDGR